MPLCSHTLLQHGFAVPSIKDGVFPHFLSLRCPYLFLSKFRNDVVQFLRLAPRPLAASAFAVSASLSVNSDKLWKTNLTLSLLEDERPCGGEWKRPC